MVVPKTCPHAASPVRTGARGPPGRKCDPSQKNRVKAYSESGESERSWAPSSVSPNRSGDGSVMMPTAASMRNNRRSDGSWVPVSLASSALLHTRPG